MQGRQRVINEHSFWRSKRLEKVTAEDRASLVYVLTSPFSNICGVYQFLPRIAAAELGWDLESQLLPVLRRIDGDGLIAFDEARSFIWVKIWWDHNSATAACGPSLLGSLIKEIRAMPDSWRQEFLLDFLGRLPLLDKNLHPFKRKIAARFLSDGLLSRDAYSQLELQDDTQCPSADAFSEASADIHEQGRDRVSTGCRHPVDTLSAPSPSARSALPAISKSKNSSITNINLYKDLRMPAAVAEGDRSEVAALLTSVPREVAQRFLDAVNDKERAIPVAKVVAYLRTAIKNYRRDADGVSMPVEEQPDTRGNREESMKKMFGYLK